jgi:hypothetical protein
MSEKLKAWQKKVRFYAYAGNEDEALKNGSFVRCSKKYGLARFSNGDFMGFLDEVPADMAEVPVEKAWVLIPRCCK